MSIRHGYVACADGLQSVAMVLLYSDSFQLPRDYPDYNRIVHVAMGTVTGYGSLDVFEHRWLRGRQSEAAFGRVSQVLEPPEHQADE
jgi:hypothetical protein